MVSYRDFPALEELMCEALVAASVARCVTCGGRFIPRKPQHIECQPCWAVTPLLIRVARLSGVHERRRLEWPPLVIRLARALTGEVRRSGTVKWDDE